MEIKFSPDDTPEETLRKQLYFEKELNKKLIRGLSVLSGELETIANASKDTSASELRTYAFECLLRYGNHE
jgi:hypothetical protein